MSKHIMGMPCKIISIVLILVLMVGCGPVRDPQSASENISKIAFGSCGEQYKPQPILSLAASKDPDLFIFLGDNIYADTYNMDTLRKKYDMLASKSEFQKLKSSTSLLATWDDHDYGWNDAGRHYPHKEESKAIFLDFFGFADSTVLEHEGIYQSKIFGDADHRLQIILLDLRTFRDDLLPYNGNRDGQPGFNYQLEYSPYATSDSTIMGEEQWAWLEKQLAIPADIRIIGSSTQFGITDNGYEAWANFPHEQQRLVDLIKKTKAEGVIIISGDVHYSEISKFQADGLYPLYDVTASGITSTWDFATPNDNRIDGPVMENHFGLLTIDWEKDDPEITMEIWDVSGERRIQRKITLGELKIG